MSDPKLDLLEIASRISDGDKVDWEGVERSVSTDEERRMVSRLRLVENLAEVHRREEVASTVTKDPLKMSRTVDASFLEAEPGLGKWGRLVIRAKIGEGAFGEVYRAWDANLHREVALKLLKKEAVERKDLASAVLDEGRLLARIQHPNVITVHGAETHDGRVGLWMDCVRGRTLADLLTEQGKLGAREAALIGLDLCRALAAVHAAGLVHRDVKARNVMREEGGRILLMDFGAGRDLHDVESRGDRTISGTPLYIAPEVFQRQPATARSDIYSLGVLLYHLVTGSYPLKATSLEELRDKHRRHQARLLRDERSDLPEAFVKVVERATAWDPDRRFATAGEMEQALAAALGVDSAEAVQPAAEPDAVESRRGVPRWALVATFAVAAVVLAAWGLQVVPFLANLLRDDKGASAPIAQGDARLESAKPSESTPTPGTYTVDAALYRVNPEGQQERLAPGARLTVGDRLFLTFEASRSLYVYIINEDDKGNAYALFPLPGFDLENPLPPSGAHELPGKRGGKSVSWEVSSAGGREHLLVLASPERLVDFEAEMNALPRPHEGQIAVPIPQNAKIRLRGIGGLAEIPERATTGSARSLFEMAGKLAGRTEVVEGVWFRRIDLDNPSP